MKFAVILALGFVAAVVAIPNNPGLRSRRQAASTTASPNCDGKTGSGLGGLLTQVGYLVGNLLDNVLAIRTNGDGSVLQLLSNLLTQVQRLLTDLLGPGVTDEQANEKQGLLAQLLADIVALVNNLLGNGAATTWTCTRPKGVVGGLLATVIGSLGGVTGSSSNDRGLLSGLLTVVLNLVTSLLAALL